MGKKEPANEIEIGRIRVTIWPNETEDRRVWFNAVISRRYKSGEVWKETTSLKHDDLLNAMKAIELAFRWIYKQEAQARKAKPKPVSKKLAHAGR